MSRTIDCIRYGAGQEGLDRAPYPGELGERIYREVSRRAWSEWLAQQTMLLNENRWSPVDPQVRKRLKTEMEAFLFGPGSAPPPGYVAPDSTAG